MRRPAQEAPRVSLRTDVRTAKWGLDLTLQTPSQQFHLRIMGSNVTSTVPDRSATVEEALRQALLLSAAVSAAGSEGAVSVTS